MGLLTLPLLAQGAYLIGKNLSSWKSNLTNHVISNDYQSILGDSRQQALEDRVHTEMREDTAYQRAVADMKAAGLNPLALGGVNPAASSPSTANMDSYQAKLDMLGYVLNLRNVNMSNTEKANRMLGDLLEYQDQNNSGRRLENWITDFFGGNSNIWSKAKK